MNQTSNNDGCKLEYDYGGILLSAVAEVFGLIIAILLIDRGGRRLTQASLYAVGGQSITTYVFVLSTFGAGGKRRLQNPAKRSLNHT